jgi:hypothetical protein
VISARVAPARRMGAPTGDATTWDARAAAVMIRLLAWRAPGEKHSGEAADERIELSPFASGWQGSEA